MVGHCRDTLRFGTAGIVGGWALQGYLVVGHCRDALQLGTSVKHCRDTHWFGSAGILGGWSLKSVFSRARTTSTLKSNSSTARVGNKTHMQTLAKKIRAHLRNVLSFVAVAL